MALVYLSYIKLIISLYCLLYVDINNEIVYKQILDL